MFTALRHLARLEEPARLKGYLFLLALTMGSSLLDALGVALIFPLITLISDPGLIGQYPILSGLKARFALSSPTPLLLFLTVSMGFAFLLKNAYLALFYRLQLKFVAEGADSLARRTFDLYLRCPYSFHLIKNTAELNNRVARLARGNYSALVTALISLVADLLVAIAVLLTLMALQPFITMVAGGVLGTLILLQYRAFSRRFRSMGQDMVVIGDAQTAFLQQSLAGVKEIKVRGCQAHFIDHFDRIQHRLSSTWRRNQFISRLPTLLTESALMLSIVIALSVLMLTAESTSEILGSLGLLGAAALRLMPMSNRIVLGLNVINENSAAMGVLHHDFTTLLAEDAQPAGAVLPFRETLRLRDVSFTFPTGSRPALAGLDITIRRGEFIGLVGASGAGKSTLGDIILGVLPPDRGGVEVDGGAVADWRAWRRNVGYVPQHIYVFDDTIRRNIAIGCADAEIDDQRVRDALRLARLDGLVRDLPQGLDTRMGENGVRLSGGQRQRLGIARALYGGSEVLLMDEATSALDVHTEHEITEAVLALKGNKTLIVIAHRLSTLRHCDRLIFLENGRVRNEGSFDTLCRDDPAFAHLVELSKLQPSPSDQPAAQGQRA